VASQRAVFELLEMEGAYVVESFGRREARGCEIKLVEGVSEMFGHKRWP
jgi:hypothetical protein